MNTSAPLPAAGGSYVRNADGSLTLAADAVEQTRPDPGRDPGPDTVVPAAPTPKKKG